jgi:hypothetical protein
VLGFRDDSRVTLNSGTRLALAQFSFDAAQPARGNMLLQLLSGGLRVATGLIAKAAPRQVLVKTSTATVGIRGTVFDLACGKAEASDNPPEADLTDRAATETDRFTELRTRDRERKLIGKIDKALKRIASDVNTFLVTVANWRAGK